MGLELSNIVRLPSDLQPLALQKEALQARILEEAAKKEQITETVANELILGVVTKHLPQAANGYRISQPLAILDALLTTVISQIDRQRSYVFTRLFVTDDNTLAYNELAALQSRLAKATIIKAPMVISSIVLRATPAVSFSASQKAARTPSALVTDLQAAFHVRTPLEVEDIEEKLSLAKATRAEQPIDADTLSEVRCKNLLKKVPVEAQAAVLRNLDAAKKAHERQPFYLAHLQNLRKTALRLQDSLESTDQEAERRYETYRQRLGNG